jgi:hypothetical protein
MDTHTVAVQPCQCREPGCQPCTPPAVQTERYTLYVGEYVQVCAACYCSGHMWRMMA